VAAYCRAGADRGAAGARPARRQAGPAGHQGGQGGDWELVDGAPVAAGVALQEGEYELKLVAADVENSAPLPAGRGVVVLDTAVTPELAAEGLARDVIRVVQQARRDAGPGRLGPDRADRRGAARCGGGAAHRDFVAGETLATSVDFGGRGDGFAGEVGDGETVTVAVHRLALECDCTDRPGISPPLR
jgi:isoleucyl-tRNA synthetase